MIFKGDTTAQLIRPEKFTHKGLGDTLILQVVYSGNAFSSSFRHTLLSFPLPLFLFSFSFFFFFFLFCSLSLFLASPLRTLPLHSLNQPWMSDLITIRGQNFWRTILTNFSIASVDTMSKFSQLFAYALGSFHVLPKWETESRNSHTLQCAHAHSVKSTHTRGERKKEIGRGRGSGSEMKNCDEVVGSAHSP